MKFLVKLHRTIKYYRRRKVWLDSHKPEFKVITPTLARRVLIDEKDESNQRKLRFLRKHNERELNRVLKEIESEKKVKYGL